MARGRSRNGPASTIATSVAPAVPGTIPPGFFDGLEISGVESRIAYMRFRQKKMNRPGVPVIIGGTAAEAKLKEDAAHWLRQGAS